MPQDFFRGGVFLTWLLRRFLISCDVIVVLSSAEVSAYRAFDARLKVHSVPNAIDPAGLADQTRSFNTSRPLKLVYVGRLVRAKGLFEVIEALMELKRAGREFELSIAGGGPDQSELMAALERADLKDRVRFLGSVFAGEKYRLWLDSDLFVFPTFHPEGLPYSLLEAMAAGCVPLTTPWPAFPDVVGNAEPGLFFRAKIAGGLRPPGPALTHNPTRLVRMAEAARRRVLELYTDARLADGFRETYPGCFTRFDPA